MRKLNRQQIPDAIAARKMFAGSNTDGDWMSPEDIGFGQLNPEYRTAIRELYGKHSNVYVVRSYATPIGWYVFDTGQWTIPKTYYSSSTSTHQGMVRRGATQGGLELPVIE